MSYFHMAKQAQVAFINKWAMNLCMTNISCFEGKTYTLIGNSNDAALNHCAERGILPRVAETIFERKKFLECNSIAGSCNCIIKLSVLEIYQEKLKDLLVGNSAQKQPDTQLRLREQIDGAVWVEGLTELSVSSEEEFQRLISTAMKKRVVGSHNMNAVSSRSHLCCILSLSLVQNEIGKPGDRKINSKLHLVDLAGSEMVSWWLALLCTIFICSIKVRKTDAKGVRFDEAKHINKSLSALGNVIFALSSNNNAASAMSAGKSHVPFRDSKLTRLLQNSLAGNAKTLIILAVSAAMVRLKLARKIN